MCYAVIMRAVILRAGCIPGVKLFSFSIKNPYNVITNFELLFLLKVWNYNSELSACQSKTVSCFTEFLVKKKQ